jgi:hypothetical protein
MIVSLLLTGACVPTASPEAGTSAPPPSATIGEAPSAIPSTTAMPEISWSEHAFDGQVNAVAVDGARLVAVGATAEGSDAWTSAAWTSPDGVTWEQHAVPQSSVVDDYTGTNAGGESMGPLARLGDTLFSFGSFSAYDGDVVQPVGWRSADGTEWESIESENTFFVQGGGVHDLVAGDPGLLALTRGPVVEYGGEMWLWTAETSWVQTTPTNASEPGTSAADILDAVWSDAVWADEKFVAVGVAASLDPANPSTWRPWASSWVSTDGRIWQSAPPSEDREASMMNAVSPLPGGGFVAVGCNRCAIQEGLETPAAWTSLDGLTWTPVALPADFEGAPYGVIQVGSGLLAIGAAPNGTATWTSADGMSWQAGPLLSGTAYSPIHNLALWWDEVVLFLYRELEFGVAHDSVLLRGVVRP